MAEPTMDTCMRCGEPYAIQEVRWQSHVCGNPIPPAAPLSMEGTTAERYEIRDAWTLVEEAYVNGAPSAVWISCATAFWKRIDEALAELSSSRRALAEARAQRDWVAGLGAADQGER